jgi:O-Antigen ligase
MVAPRTEPPGGESTPSGSDSAAGRRTLGTISETQVAVATLAIISSVLIWWALKQGAYFATVFMPGAVILYGLLIMLLVAAPFNGRIGPPARIALISIAALAAWTLLSIAWTDSHDSAVQDAEKAMLYGAMFALGLWSSGLAGRRRMLPLAAVAVTGTVVGVIATVTLATGTDVTSYFHSDATFRFPIGYRNAEAAFLLICFWPLIVLAAEAGLRWQLRALTVGAGTMLLELAVLAESRGSAPAALVAIVVLIVLSPRRLRIATYLALAAVPVLPALPTLLDVFQHGGSGAALVPLMRDSARAIALTSLGSVVLAAVFVRGVEMRLDLGRERIALISRIAATIAIAAVVVGGTIAVSKQGGPFGFIDQRVSEFKQGGDPNLETQGTRFGVNVGSNRRDFWRVGLDEAGDHLLAGGGAGSFAIAYLSGRHSSETPRDPHSVEVLMLSELGVVGFLLFATFVVAGVVAGLRARRLGPSAAALSAGCLTAGAYWLVHSSYDWFWHYPAITAPALFLFGAAAAAPLAGGSDRRLTPVRWAAVTVLVVALLGAMPLFFSQRYADSAYDEYPGNPSAALSDLDRAADLDPFDPQPLLAKGLIESRLGNRQQAVTAFRDAAGREPKAYAAHYFLARELAPIDLASARSEAAEALRLNPLDLQTRSLNRRLQRVKSS